VSIPPSKKNPVLIINPVSGRGDGRNRVKELQRIAHNLGWQGYVLETTPEKHAGVLAKKLVAEGYRHLVICGGDGSVMETLDAVAGTTTQLGIVPLGTGNLFALNLKIPQNIAAAMKVALHGQSTSIDVGFAEKTYFGVAVGIGWDAAVIRDAKRELKDRLGLLAYFLAALRNLEHPISNYRVIVDHAAPLEVKAKSVLVANMGLIPGSIQVIPKARPNSGELTVAIVQAESLLSWLALSASALTGRMHDDPNIQLITGKHIVIESLDGPQLVEADGNDLPPTERLVVDVIPGGATILLPRR